MFAALIPLVLSLAPQLAGMIFGSKGDTATTKVASVVQTVIGAVADLSSPDGVEAAIAHIHATPQVAADLQSKLAELHVALQKEHDAEIEAERKDAIDELKSRLGDTASARDMATQLAKANSGLAYGGVIVSVVIVTGFAATTYAVLTNHLSATDGQFGSVLVGTLAAMATQVANYWLGSSVGSSAKNALLAHAQNNLATSVPADSIRMN
jgi:hypothetical protein